MTDVETPPEAPIEERFRIVHDHLNLVEQTLDELTGELETELEAVLEDTPINIEYDIDTDSFQAALSTRCEFASTILILRPSMAKTGTTGQRPAMKDIIQQLQQADEQRVGVPKSTLPICNGGVISNRQFNDFGLILDIGSEGCVCFRYRGGLRFSAGCVGATYRVDPPQTFGRCLVTKFKYV